MLKKVLVNLAGSLYQREASPTFVLQDGVLVPNEKLVNARHHNGKLVFDQGYENNKAQLIAGGDSDYPYITCSSSNALLELPVYITKISSLSDIIVIVDGGDGFIYALSSYYAAPGVYKINKDGSGTTLIYSIPGQTSSGSIVLADIGDGFLYTSTGGTYGTLVKITKTGVEVARASNSYQGLTHFVYQGSDGTVCVGYQYGLLKFDNNLNFITFFTFYGYFLLQSSDGYFYAIRGDKLYRITINGTITSYNLSSTVSVSGLIEDSSGLLYTLDSRSSGGLYSLTKSGEGVTKRVNLYMSSLVNGINNFIYVLGRSSTSNPTYPSGLIKIKEGTYAQKEITGLLGSTLLFGKDNLLYFSCDVEPNKGLWVTNG